MQKTDIELAAAGFFPRLGAYLLDRLIAGTGVLLLVRLPLMIASFSTDFFTREVFFRYNLRQIVCWLAVSAYFTVFTARSGATPGKRAFGMRVIKEDGTPLSFVTALYRETVGRYLSSLLCIGYLLILGDADHRSLHDHICDTLVVFSDARRERPVRRAPAQKKAAPVPTLPTGAADNWYSPNRL